MTPSVALVALVALALPLLSIRFAFAGADHTTPPLVSIPWPWILRLVAILCLFGPEVIHTAVIESHLEEWIPAGFFFLGLSFVEGGLGIALALAPSRWLCWVAIAVTAAVVTVWGVSRTMGLPFGPEAYQPEALGRPDLITTLLEVIRISALLPLACGPRLRKLSAPSGQMRSLLGGVVLVAIATLTVLGVNGVRGHNHSEALRATQAAAVRAQVA